MKRALPMLLTALALLSPLSAVTADGAMWNATSVGDVGYLPLEDLRSFYKLLPLPQKESGTRAVGNGAVSLVFGPGARELRIHGVRCILSHPVRDEVTNKDLLLSKEDMVKLIDPVLRPTYIANRRLIKTIVLDPGHGGHDAGTVTPYAREADITLTIATKLAEELKKRGHHVVLTHEANHYLSDQQRVDMANNALNAAFISLHLNSGRSDICGAETYTMAPAAADARPLPGNEYDAANMALGMALQSSLVQGCGAPDGGCRRARYSLLSSLNCPAALVELGYATHAAEGARLNTETYQTRIVQSLADGIERFVTLMNPDTVLQASDVPAAADEPAAPAPVEAGRSQPPADPAKNTKNNNRRSSGKSTGSSKKSDVKSTGSTRRTRR